MTISQFLARPITGRHRPVVKCNDGFEMSVQASEYHYCSPRVNDAIYNEVEIGFPSDEEPLIMPWVEDSNDPTGTVYGYVPVSVIDEVLVKHGGINEDATFS